MSKVKAVILAAVLGGSRTWNATRALPSRYCPPRRQRCVEAKNQNDPVLAVSARGGIYAAWMDDWDVVFMRSSDHGRTWQCRRDLECR